MFKIICHLIFKEMANIIPPTGLFEPEFKFEITAKYLSGSTVYGNYNTRVHTHHDHTT